MCQSKVGHSVAVRDEVVKVGITQPCSSGDTNSLGTNNLGDRLVGLRSLHVERHVKIVATFGVEGSKGRDVLGEISIGDRGDRHAADTAPDDAVMNEHGDPVGSHPDITLDASRSEPARQREGFDRVVRGMGSRPAVGESKGRIKVRR